MDEAKVVHHPVWFIVGDELFAIPKSLLQQSSVCKSASSNCVYEWPQRDGNVFRWVYRLLTKRCTLEDLLSQADVQLQKKIGIELSFFGLGGLGTKAIISENILRFAKVENSSNECNFEESLFAGKVESDGDAKSPWIKLAFGNSKVSISSLSFKIFGPGGKFRVLVLADAPGLPVASAKLNKLQLVYGNDTAILDLGILACLDIDSYERYKEEVCVPSEDSSLALQSFYLVFYRLGKERLSCFLKNFRISGTLDSKL